METLLAFMESHGYAALYVLGMAEFAGFPVASTPVVLAAGAIAATGSLDPVLVGLSVVAGGLTSDVAWYALARWRGSAIVDSACGLSSNPKVCVLGVSEKLARIGAPYILVGKFIPGTSAMLAAGSGLAGIGRARFVLVDGIALALWATVYTGLGWAFSDELGPVLVWITSHIPLVVAALVLSFVGAGIARWWKAGLHDHGKAPAAPVDVRSRTMSPQPPTSSSASIPRTAKRASRRQPRARNRRA